MARKRGITIEDVSVAAAELADTEGIEGVTLAAVAARVGVRSPSLYSHVQGLDGVRRLLALRAARAIGEALADAAEGKEGVQALEALAHGYRRFVRHHPGLYEASQRAVAPGEDDELYDALRAAIVPVLKALGEAGVPREEHVHLTRAIRSALHGFVVLEGSAGFGIPESVDESFARLTVLLLDGVRARAR